MNSRILAGASVCLLALATVTPAQQTTAPPPNQQKTDILAVQGLSKADEEKALQLLEQTQKDVEAATKGLSEAQWNFKPAPERWSVAQCMEHIAAAEDLLRGMIAEKVMVSGPAPADRDVQKIDAAIIAGVEDRSHKVQAPEPLVPTNRFGSPEAALKHFEESRAKTEQFLKSTPDLRAHAMPGPTGAPMDAYEWILLIGAHSERHTKQMLEVKADPNFPKN